MFKIILASQSVQMLLSASTNVTWPARLGSGISKVVDGSEVCYDLIFDDQERAEHMIRIVSLRETLRAKYTEKIGSQYLAGNAKNWRPKPNTTDRWEIINPDLPMELELESSAYHAIYWLCLWMTHPASSNVKAGLLDEYVFPMVRLVGEWEQLMYDLGLREDEPSANPVRQSLTAAPLTAPKNGH
jgi:hypothetical protein